MNLDVEIIGIDDVIKKLESYASEIESKKKELCRKLAEIGVNEALFKFTWVSYIGQMDVEVHAEERNGVFYIVASGETVLILEFGAGVIKGYGHPQNSQFGMGPTTYPGQTHAESPHGWWLPKEKGGYHTVGNEPSMAMYNTAQDLRSEIERVAREVFHS